MKVFQVDVNDDDITNHSDDLHHHHVSAGEPPGVDGDGLTGHLPHPHGGGQDLHPGANEVHSRVGVLKAREDNEAAIKATQESHLEADDVAEEFTGSEAEHGDPSDDSVLAEEAAEDHVPLPDVGQVPGQMFSLLTLVKMIIRTNLDSSRIW